MTKIIEVTSLTVIDFSQIVDCRFVQCAVVIVRYSANQTSFSQSNLMLEKVQYVIGVLKIKPR